MFNRRLLIGFSALSIAAFGLAPISYAREGERGDHHGNGGHEIQLQDDHGADRLVEVQAGDDRGVDAAAQPQTLDDNGVDPQPHA